MLQVEQPVLERRGEEERGGEEEGRSEEEGMRGFFQKAISSSLSPSQLFSTLLLTPHSIAFR